jgi:hypothetical protein
MSRERSENQFYGKFFECCTVAALNKEEVQYKENFTFSQKEQDEIFKDACMLASYLGAHKAIYTGDKTGTQSGDILLDCNTNLEIKYVSSGTGTYFNTSIFYFDKFGFDFKEYMNHYGLYDILEELGVVKVSRTNNSPISQKDSSYIRHSCSDFFETKIKPIDAKMRQAFTLDIIDFFQKHPSEAYTFITDMLNKNSATSRKTAPDRLVVFNYKKKSISELYWKDSKEDISTIIRPTDTGFVIGNIRVQLSWQNGVGLNNPTIRVFLER